MNRAFGEATCYGIAQCAQYVGPDYSAFFSGLIIGCAISFVVLWVGKRGRP